MPTIVTIECECGTEVCIPVTLADDQLALANAPLIDTLVQLFTCGCVD